MCVQISIQIKKDMIKLLQKQNGAVFMPHSVYDVHTTHKIKWLDCSLLGAIEIH